MFLSANIFSSDPIDWKTWFSPATLGSWPLMALPLLITASLVQPLPTGFVVRAARRGSPRLGQF